MVKKNKSKILFGLVSVLSSTFLVGCSSSNRLKNSETFTEVYGELETFASDKYKNYTAVVKDFNLGKKNFENAIDIDMKGLISYPKEKENAPVLIILAGNENLVKEDNGFNKNLYRGYKYLAESLAESGFLTVVIDTQFKDSYFSGEIVEDKILEELFDYHIEKLRDAISGASNVYGVNLYNKGDINKIGLIGQSSTARNIFNICNRKYNENDFRIKGLLSITPGESLSVASAYPDVPTSILVAEHSVNTKIGFDIYNEIEKTAERNNFASLTYLIGGDSRKFNEKIEEDKILEAKVDEINKITESKIEENNSVNMRNIAVVDNEIPVVQDSESVLTEEKVLMNENTDLIVDTSLYENFLSSYCTSFFKTIFEEDTEFKNIFLGLSPSPSKLYGMNVLNKYCSGDKAVLYSPDVSPFIKNAKFDIENVVESSISDLDTAINFNEPTTVMELKLKKLKWEKEHPNITVPLKINDFSDYNAINLRWAIDSSSALNVVSQKVATVTIEDKRGNKSSVTLNSENALRKIDGREKTSENGVVNWSRYTPLSDTRIPVSIFKNIDLKNIKTINISFDNADSGSVYLESISLVD